jgi:polar amino acid transport system permease protein
VGTVQGFLNALAAAGPSLIHGFLLTVAISAAAVVVGALIGVGIGLALTYGGRVGSAPFRIIVDVVRGTPVLVLILASFYMPAGLGWSPGPITAGVIALSVFCACHMGETLRGALITIPPPQTEAAFSIGLTFPKTLLYVLLPQAARQIAPNFINTVVEIVKASSLISVIGVGELLLTTQEVIGRTFRTMEFYAICGGLYLILNLAISGGGWWIERRYRLR